MTISYIPSELIQAILLQVDGPKHKDFLASCTLVCKRWLPLARSLLFTDITLRVGKSEEVQFCELARLDPNIALSIRDVHLRALNQPDPVPLSHLQEILCVLPRLKSLQIMRTFPVTEDEHHTEKTTHTLAKLSLAFAAGDSGWVPFLKCILPLFSHIGLLELLYSQIADIPELTPDPQFLLSQARPTLQWEPSAQIAHPPLPVISAFYWGRAKANRLNDFPLTSQRWLLDHLAAVRYLTLVQGGIFDRGHNEFFSRISSTVEFLQLHVAVTYATKLYCPTFTRDVLATCTKLYSFTLSLGYYMTDAALGMGVADELLRSLPHTVRRLRLHLPWAVHDPNACGGLAAACRTVHDRCKGGLLSITWLYAQDHGATRKTQKDEREAARTILREFDEDGLGILRFDDERWWVRVD